MNLFPTEVSFLSNGMACFDLQFAFHNFTSVTNMHDIFDIQQWRSYGKLLAVLHLFCCLNLMKIQ